MFRGGMDIHLKRCEVNVCPEMQTPALHCCVSAIRTHGELRREKLCSHFKLLQLCTVSAKPSSAAGNRYVSA